MARREIPGSIGAAAAAASLFPWEAIQEINEHSIELLVQLARSAANPLLLSPTLRELLRQTSPDDRKHAAARAYLLIDLAFRNLPWWEAIHRSPEKQFPGSVGRNALPKRSAVPLARTLLVATREAIRADKEIACLMLGVELQVADLISGLKITEIDRIAGHQFLHMEFRWLDRPAIWRSLLLIVGNPKSLEEHRFDAHCLQLLIGDMLANTEATGENRRLP